ncbi:MAG: flagellar hook-length control protein FliK, partial [Thermodesulfovibrionales bacterium]
EVPLEIGQVLTLRVMDPLSDGRIRLQVARCESMEKTQGFLETKIQSILQDLEGMISGDLKGSARKFEIMLAQILKALPEDTSLLPPEMRRGIADLLLRSLRSRGSINEKLSLLNSLINREGVDVRVNVENLLKSVDLQPSLRNIFENTGVLLETRLKRVLKGESLEEGLSGLLKEDLKANLLKLKGEGLINKTVSNIVRDIETFQVLSKVTDSFYTFLPLIWRDLKDGDIMFRRGELKTGGNTFTCRINLKLERYGKLSVIVLLNNKNFFVSFVVENSDFKKLLEESKELLQSSFLKKGLNLKVINVIASDIESPWPDIIEGIDYRV